ncbi:MAG: alpha/beta hydrolase [Alphaproteobacteria bacterium]
MIPLFLLPGLLNDAELWTFQRDNLKDIAATHVPELYHHDNIPDLARHVLAGAPDRFALAGLSMGGYVAMEIMRQAPSRVLKLALFDTSARSDTAEQTEKRKGLLVLAQTGKFKGVTPRLLPSLLHHDHLDDTKITTSILAMAARVGREGFIRQQTAIMHRIDSRPSLAQIACPTRIVVGAQDQLTPLPIAEEMATLIPQAQLVVFQSCGHLPPLEKPEATAHLLRGWLLEE